MSPWLNSCSFWWGIVKTTQFRKLLGTRLRFRVPIINKGCLGISPYHNTITALMVINPSSMNIGRYSANIQMRQWLMGGTQPNNQFDTKGSNSTFSMQLWTILRKKAVAIAAQGLRFRGSNSTFKLPKVLKAVQKWLALLHKRQKRSQRRER